jgi:hypothetical protein
MTKVNMMMGMNTHHSYDLDYYMQGMPLLHSLYDVHYLVLCILPSFYYPFL